MESDEDGIMLEDSYKMLVNCHRDKDVLTIRGTKGMCLTLVTPEYKPFNASSADVHCDSFGYELATAKDDREMNAIIKWENTYGRGETWPKLYVSILVNARYDEETKQFVWLDDHSPVRMDDDSLWPWGKNITDSYGHDTKCLTVRWVDKYFLAFEPVACKQRLYSMVCSRKPNIIK